MLNLSIIGTGYVGLVSAVCFADKGFNVICVDNNLEKIQNLEKGIVPIYEEGLEEMCLKNYREGKIKFTTNLQYAVQNSDVVFIAVGTPPLENGEVDLSQVVDVAVEIGKCINSYKVIVNKSTVPIGAQKLVKNLILKNLKQTVEFDVVSNPEFLREGVAINDTLNPDRIIIGSESERAKDIINKVYENFNAPILNVIPETSEMIKYASNTFLALKVSYINEIANICERVGADVLDVAKGIGLDPRIGNKFLNAGIGFGGACFPKDTTAIYNIAKQYGYDFKIAKTLFAVNEEQKIKPFEKLMKIMSGDIKDKNIAVLGLAFKPGTDDMRGAPSIKIIERLVESGAKVTAYDPISVKNAQKVIKQEIVFSTDLYEAVELADAIIVATEWENIKNINISKVSKLVKDKIVIDGRNCMDAVGFKKAGFKYCCIGRIDDLYYESNDYYLSQVAVTKEND